MNHSLKLSGLIILIFIIAAHHSFAQQFNLPLNRKVVEWYEPIVYAPGSGIHTSVKPFRLDEIGLLPAFDSVANFEVGNGKFYNTWVGRKLLYENLVRVRTEDFLLNIDPLVDLQVGRDLENDDNVYVNTRGVRAEGKIGNKVYFNTMFFENQATFVHYLDSSIRINKVVPGQGRIKTFKDNGFDFAMAYGNVIFKPSRHFTFQFGNDKNFIGDGYRSLLLSDNAFNYPALKVTTDVWKIKYTNLYTVFQDLRTPFDPAVGFRKKYGTFHYLDLAVGKRLSVGLFEGIIWKSDTTGQRGYDINYLNPIIFFRPVEFSLGSPDNALLGLNTSYRITAKHILYGQIVLDEFLLDEVKSGNGWHGNKQGFQIGYKGLDLGLPGLRFQTEYNFVRPYTYQHLSTQQNYGHYNEALAHPLGANFWESVSILGYSYHRFHLDAKMVYAMYGADSAGFNYGHNIFKNYSSRPFEYGHKMLQGLETTLLNTEVTVSYLVNPKYNFNIELGVAMRDLSNDQQQERSQLVRFGFRTAITNHYYDF